MQPTIKAGVLQQDSFRGKKEIDLHFSLEVL